MRRTGATPKSAEGELDLEICLEFDGAEFNEAAKHKQANASGVSQTLQQTNTAKRGSNGRQ